MSLSSEIVACAPKSDRLSCRFVASQFVVLHNFSEGVIAVKLLNQYITTKSVSPVASPDRFLCLTLLVFIECYLIVVLYYSSSAETQQRQCSNYSIEMYPELHG